VRGWGGGKGLALPLLGGEGRKKGGGGGKDAQGHLLNSWGKGKGRRKKSGRFAGTAPCAALITTPEGSAGKKKKGRGSHNLKFPGGRGKRGKDTTFSGKKEKGEKKKGR